VPSATGPDARADLSEQERAIAASVLEAFAGSEPVQDGSARLVAPGLLTDGDAPLTALRTLSDLLLRPPA